MRGRKWEQREKQGKWKGEKERGVVSDGEERVFKGAERHCYRFQNVK